ncbi:MAG: Hsp33 family molecular chaperone HslO [Clostridia bacterium]|nr:Hsp33 family molecular chaperone HslO [Clostridia bacterium]MBR3818396.1 Hsp33 family molecular chaperone HslO [Clostridia bacterium]
MSELVRMISTDGTLTVIAVDSTDIINRMEKIHMTSAVTSAALGRLLTAASMMGAVLKGRDHSVTLRLNGNGPSGSLIAVSDSEGNVRGYVANPVVEIPLNDKGKLDVAGAVGTDGTLTVMKDLGMKEPYIGQIPIVSGEIAEDITSYFATSEQLPSVCALGVLVNPDLSIQAAGGFIIQLLPTALEDTIDQVEECIKGIPSVTQMLTSGMTPEDICRSVLKTFDLEILDTAKPEYRCNCSRERVTKALLTMGKEELVDMANDPFTEVDCHFCEKKYRFTSAEIRKLAE